MAAGCFWSGVLLAGTVDIGLSSVSSALMKRSVTPTEILKLLICDSRSARFSASCLSGARDEATAS